MARKVDMRAVGDDGEARVAAELKRRGWTVRMLERNAPLFDLVARKGDREVWINAKTHTPPSVPRIRTGPGMVQVRFEDSTYIVIVRRDVDPPQFYVVPKYVVFKECSDRQQSNIAKGRLPNGPFRMGFKDNSRNPGEPGYDLERKWAYFLENWKILEQPLPPPGI